eukprot:COSAG05_NODE_3002_length_2421_cov_1.928510_2_plen_129_part_00
MADYSLSQAIIQSLTLLSYSLSRISHGVDLDFTAEFVWLGQNAIASWGFLDGETDATMTNSGLGGLQPRGTLVEENWVHEIGHLQKQSSFYFQAITAQTVIRKCVCARARECVVSRAVHGSRRPRIIQ